MTESLPIDIMTASPVTARLEVRVRGFGRRIAVPDVRHVPEVVAGLDRKATVVINIGDARSVAWAAAESLAGMLTNVGAVEVRGTSSGVAQLTTALGAFLLTGSLRRGSV